MDAANNNSDGIAPQSKPALGLGTIINMAVGFFGIQIAFALQNANASRVFETLGADVDRLALFWLAGPLTGLIIQPIVGHLSDNTWTRFGRRRPFFLAGAIWAMIALFFMPRMPELWMAVASLWILDASINISMEPFRAFVGDMLPARQRTLGYSVQTVFIGAGGLLGSWLPAILNWAGVSNEAVNGGMPDNVVLSFTIGAALVILAIGWTIITTREYPPDQALAFQKAELEQAGTAASDHESEPKPMAFFWLWGAITIAMGGVALLTISSMALERELYVLGWGIAVLGILFCLRALMKNSTNFLTEVLDDLVGMPRIMKQLAVVQFFSWVGFFVMWIYSTSAIAGQFFGNSDPNSQAYQNAGDWVGVVFGFYNLVSAIYAFVMPSIAARVGLRKTHAFGLLCGAAGLASYLLFTDKNMLFVTMLLIGIAWGSVLTMPYAILSNGIPPRKMGIYMGIFNFFIVLPQLVVGTIMGSILNNLLGGQTILIFLVGAGSFLLAAISVMFVDSTRHRWAPDGPK